MRLLLSSPGKYAPSPWLFIFNHKQMVPVRMFQGIFSKLTNIALQNLFVNFFISRGYFTVVVESTIKQVRKDK